MNQTIVSNGKASLLAGKLVEIVKFDPKQHPRFCITCGVEDKDTPISARGYCKYHEMQIDMEYYNLYVY